MNLECPQLITEDGRTAAQACRPLDVWVLDPWCRTPWYTAELARALQIGGHSVRLVSPSYHLEPSYFAQERLHPRPGLLDVASRLPFRNGALSRCARLVEYGLNTAALAMEVRANPPSVVHQQQCVLLERGRHHEVAFLRWARSHGIPIVHTVHNLLPHSGRSYHREVFGRFYRSCDALICHDSSTAESLGEQFDVDASRIHIVPHGPLFAHPPRATTQECRRLLGLPENRQVYVILGVLAQYKGVDVLLRAWEKFLQSRDARGTPLLLIAGDGPEVEKAKVRAQAGHLIASGSVRADLHYIPAAQVPVYMQAADVLLYPYREITTSGALLSGLNYCKPIIASDLAAFRGYLIPDRNARLVTASDMESLVSALLDLDTPGVFERLRIGSQSNAELQVQWSTIAMQTTAVYQSVAK